MSQQIYLEKLNQLIINWQLLNKYKESVGVPKTPIIRDKGWHRRLKYSCTYFWRLTFLRHLNVCYICFLFTNEISHWSLRESFWIEGCFISWYFCASWRQQICFYNWSFYPHIHFFDGILFSYQEKTCDKTECPDISLGATSSLVR